MKTKTAMDTEDGVCDAGSGDDSVPTVDDRSRSEILRQGYGDLSHFEPRCRILRDSD